jgi:protein-L-isoaspartate(D-aspartate) O-methyltransferase
MMAAATMDIEQARLNMIQQQIRPWEVLDPTVLELLSVVKRERFVPAAHKDLAFADVEIPLGTKGVTGQSMLAPKIEARMLQELSIKAKDKVLEIGSGSGYMAALLAARAEFVYTVDIDPELVELARKNLQQAGVANVSVDLGDAAQGWSLYAPYDVIVVSASTPVLPEAMLKQLKIGGRLIAVVGEAPAMQVQLVTRSDEEAFTTVSVFETVVAPLVNATQRKKFVF